MVIAGSTVTLPQERKFASIESIQYYIEQVCALPTIKATYPRSRVVPNVRSRRGDTKATYTSNPPTIAIPAGSNHSRWALRETVVLHELAHHLDGKSSHGPGFRQTFLTLITLCIGPEAALVLRVAWAHEGVS